MRIITLTDVHRILDNTKKESQRAIFLFMYLTGVKIGETFKLEKRDMIDSNHIKVGGRIIFIDSLIFKSYIGKYLENFLPFHRFVGIRALQKTFKNVLKKIGGSEKWTLDDLRKGFFVRCLAEGKDTSEICYSLGIKEKQVYIMRDLLLLNNGVSKKDRDLVFKRDNFTCKYCSKSSPEVELEIDHIIPVVKGGSNDLGNLQTLCKDCNERKGDKF